MPQTSAATCRGWRSLGEPRASVDAVYAFFTNGGGMSAGSMLCVSLRILRLWLYSIGILELFMLLQGKPVDYGYLVYSNLRCRCLKSFP